MRETQKDENAFTATFTTWAEDNNEWYIDSGATQHLCLRKEWFRDYKDISARKVYLADRTHIIAKGTGTIYINMDINGEESIARLNDVLYILKLHRNLLSVNRLVFYRYTVIFDNTGCTIKNNDSKIVALAKKKNNLYHIIGIV